MRLSQLIPGTAQGGELAEDAVVRGVTHDSRKVRPGDLFVAVPGARVDGAAYAREAVTRGAVAVVAQAPVGALGVPVVLVEDAARALGELADRFFGEPSRSVAVTGVTGTNGKTTTTFLLSWILEATGRRSSLLGTVQNRVAGRVEAARMTTPDAVTIHEALAASREAGIEHLVMEVSSHALAQRRTAGVRFRCGVFTNLTRDHLDYHGTVEAYGQAKARLFDELAPDAACVLNRRDAFSVELARRTRGRVITYDWREADVTPDREAADVMAVLQEERLDGTRLSLSFGGEEVPLNLPLVGRFNVENALAAAAAAWTLGVPAEEVRTALEASQGVPGRLEPVVAETDEERPAVLVDYAHTPDALERVLTALRPLVPAKLHVVFGCGGDRDRGKRPLMGGVVERFADAAYLTSDNPRSEEPEGIASDVLDGFARPEGVTVIHERAEAIRRAIEAAGPDDLVLIAGKGHETGQIVGGRTIPFDDRLVARRALLGQLAPTTRAPRATAGAASAAA